MVFPETVWTPQPWKPHFLCFCLQANAQQEVEITVSMFRTLIGSLERSQAEALEVVEMGRAAAELRSQALIRDLQLEISELRKRSSTLTQLSQLNDHFSFFKVRTTTIIIRHKDALKNIQILYILIKYSPGDY